MQSPRGARLYYSELSEMPLPAAQKTRALINYIRFSLHAHNSFRDVMADTDHRLLAASLLPAGYLAYQRDRYLLRREHPKQENQTATAGLN